MRHRNDLSKNLECQKCRTDRQSLHYSWLLWNSIENTLSTAHTHTRERTHTIQWASTKNNVSAEYHKKYWQSSKPNRTKSNVNICTFRIGTATTCFTEIEQWRQMLCWFFSLLHFFSVFARICCSNTEWNCTRNDRYFRSTSRPFATINIFALGILLHSANGSMEFHPLAWNVSYRKQVFYSQNCSARNRIILST